MTFAMRHHLSGVALADLLALIELHCCVPDLCLLSMKMIRLFFSKLKSPLEFRYYCNICPAYIGKTNGSCPVCEITKPKKSSYFIPVPLLSTLSSILTSTSTVSISFISLSHYQVNLFMKFLSHCFFFWSNF